ncbi:hypothetical protein [Pseudoalteromonas obscura]|uniref:Uncharacterized protein n=1 Tax=Pseudoalteromonas obscura TaxID=3048491 RepID=A0ABT7EE01_9GAMM|nr:hypothetical protein [Pseudoalteromonas sp. P94(2023)]MDK2593499.1 hypothetical protein [Pseudoalteromonas sp. P94(2023)]
MYSFLMVLLIGIGTLLLYLSNRHQRLLEKPLAKPMQRMGYAAVAIAIVLGAFYFIGSAGFFIALMMLMTALFSLPLLMLFLNRK